jgi:hypothetical protein
LQRVLFSWIKVNAWREFSNARGNRASIFASGNIMPASLDALDHATERGLCALQTDENEDDVVTCKDNDPEYAQQTITALYEAAESLATFVRVLHTARERL